MFIIYNKFKVINEFCIFKNIVKKKKKYYKDILLNSILFLYFILFIFNEDICGYMYRLF